MAMVCPNCGNARNFLVKTQQIYVVGVEDARVNLVEDLPSTVLEVLCDECDTAIDFAAIEDDLRKEVCRTVGVR
jgi:hypothetical protein